MNLLDTVKEAGHQLSKPQWEASGRWVLQLPSKEHTYFLSSSRKTSKYSSKYSIYTVVKIPRLFIQLQDWATCQRICSHSHFSSCPPRYFFCSFSFWEKVSLCSPGWWLELARDRMARLLSVSPVLGIYRNVLDQAFMGVLQTLLKCPSKTKTTQFLPF